MFTTAHVNRHSIMYSLLMPILIVIASYINYFRRVFPKLNIGPHIHPHGNSNIAYIYIYLHSD